MATTIQVSEELREALSAMKLMPGEKYEDVIWGLLEDYMELSEETKKTIEESLAEAKAGKTIPLEEVKRRMNVRRGVHAKGA
jgi:predicted transcriptional regulator